MLVVITLGVFWVCFILFLDEFDPTIRDYEPPSPIKLNIDTIMGRQSDQFPPQVQPWQQQQPPSHTPINPHSQPIYQQQPMPIKKANDDFIIEPGSGKKL